MPMQTLCRHCAWNGSGKLSLKNPAFVQALRQEATLSLTGAWSQISKGNCRITLGFRQNITKPVRPNGFELTMATKVPKQISLLRS